jgi:hypothetical protein
MGMITPEPCRFFDPNRLDGVLAPPVVTLNRIAEAGTEMWQLVHTIGYEDRHLGKIVMPFDKPGFSTDLTSVPQLMTWLIPRTGKHLPAALIHDSLTPPFRIVDDGQGGTKKRFDCICDKAEQITQRDADRVFRDGMADLGTPQIQRWLIWAAVSIPTGGKMAGKAWAVLLYLGLLLTAYLGVLATLDVFGISECVPWMRGSSALSDVLWGIGGAAVLPVALALPWLRPKLYRAGLICGWGIAFLLHATVVLLGATVAYQAAERLFGNTAMPPLLSEKVRRVLRRSWWAILAALAALTALLWALTVLLCRWS